MDPAWAAGMVANSLPPTRPPPLPTGPPIQAPPPQGGPPGGMPGQPQPPGLGAPPPGHGGPMPPQAQGNPQLQLPGQGQQKVEQLVNQHFQERMKALQQAVQQAGGQVYPFSIGRTPEEQDALFRRAVAKYGDEKVAAQYVSPMGKSRHEHGAGMRYGMGPGAIAADLRGDLHIAQKLAPLFGLEFNDKMNPWHVSVAGLK
jgi:D-alanyl-D-alanine carboxypeptidase